MANRVNITVALCVVLALPFVFGFDTSKYTDSKQVTSSYKLYWKIMQDTQEIALGFEVSTLGWFGFGISELTSGSMPGSDVVVVQKDSSDGHIYIEDRYTYAFAQPKRDECQENDWTLVSSEEKDGMTLVEITRPLAARDNQDRAIVRGDNAIIVAWGDNDVKSIGYHGANRLATLICFWDCPKDNVSVPNSIAMSISMPNITLPSKETTYMCYAVPFSTPNDGDVHVVRLNFVPNSSGGHAVHHMVLHLCEDFGVAGDFTSIPLLYPEPKDCTDPNPSPLGYPGCTVLYAWARGGRPLNLPEEAGFRLRSTSNSTKYLVLDMHYNNPDLVSGVIDASGIEMVATTDLRTYDASTLTLGDPAVLLPNIPARDPAFHVEITCPSECTETFPHDIHVFSDYFHMHEIGRTGYSWIHSGNESTLLNRVEFYSFANQHAVDVNVTLKPGDRINTNCVWDSSARNKSTNMYIGSKDEMCMEFITYYPAIPDIPFCGYYDYNKTPISICGRGVIPVPNPSVVDPPGGVNRTFGTSDSDLCDYTPPITAPTSTTKGQVSSGPMSVVISSLMGVLMAILLF
eukprot:TRINITY_DN456_c0_g2_i1.p1 TRINITY_DN456_c0_g2~~TRINITY_DN456_c0_g2_i1.p1  ORF type:complete len:582 (+),score=68.64 TRINITY_DN456_c0_g2_i1:28-1746(+)